MANENNNINKLVADDDDPTIDLELPKFRRCIEETDLKTFDTTGGDKTQCASTASLSEMETRLHCRDDTIARLEFDLEQVQNRYLGLKTEVAARDTQARQLNDDLVSANDGISRKETLLKKRDGRIKSLKSELRQRDDEQRKLAVRYEDLQRALEAREHHVDEAHSPLPVDKPYSVGELRLRLTRSNEYADSMRQQLQDLFAAHATTEREIDHLSLALETSTRKNLDLVDEKAQLESELSDVRTGLDAAQRQHNEEMRLLRFELGEAQDTMGESEDLNSQLASELVDAQGFKLTLEKMLAEAEEKSGARLTQSQKENTELKQRNKNLEHTATAKNEVVTALLAELARKTKQIANDAQLDDTFSTTDNADKMAPVSGERVSRVLVGIVENQMLQFPLFKDRLTVGRTKDNDIQLDVSYVSRHHAVIQTDDGSARIIDWGSKNGVNVNSQKIDEHILSHGDIIMIGSAHFRYEEHSKRDS